jgi:hypothetical protein
LLPVIFHNPLHIGCQPKLHPALSSSDHHIAPSRRSGKQSVITYQQPYARPPAVLPTLSRKRNDEFNRCSIAFHILSPLTHLRFYIVTNHVYYIGFFIQLATCNKNTVRYARTILTGSITSFVVASVRSSVHLVVIRSRRTAYSKVIIHHIHLNRKYIIQNQKYKCENNMWYKINLFNSYTLYL